MMTKIALIVTLLGSSAAIAGPINDSNVDAAAKIVINELLNEQKLPFQVVSISKSSIFWKTIWGGPLVWGLIGSEAMKANVALPEIHAELSGSQGLTKLDCMSRFDLTDEGKMGVSLFNCASAPDASVGQRFNQIGTYTQLTLPLASK
jgi:hypothetical protein